MGSMRSRKKANAFHLLRGVPEAEAAGEPRVVAVTLRRQGRRDEGIP
jgi:hypothetical protein